MELTLQQIYVHKRKLVNPDRRLSASEYSLLSIKRDASWPPLAVEGKFASQGNLKIKCEPLLDFLG
ncbi:unnamed protein product [Prunus armeniaca]